MNILTTIPDESIPAWQARVNQYNAGSGNPAVTIAQFCQIFRDEETARYVAAKSDADLLAMAGDSDLMAAGLKAMNATHGKKATAIAAFEAALLMPAPANQ